MYLLVSFSCLLISAFFFKKASGSLSLKKLNMVSWVFFYSLLIQSFVASLLVVYNLDNHYGVQKIYFEEARVKGWMAVQYCMVFLPISMWITLIFLKRKVDNSNALNAFIAKDLQSCLTPKDLVLRVFLYFLGFLSIISVVYSYVAVGMFPFQGYITTSNISSLRQTVTRDFGGVVYLKNIFGLTLAPILSYIFFCYYRLYKEKIDFLFFILLFISSVSIISFNYAKSPLAFYLLGFLFLKIILGDNIGYTKILRYSIVMVSMVVIFYLLGGYDSSILNLFSSYNSGFLGRIFISQAFGTYLSFDLYPLTYTHIGLSSLTDVFGGGRERMAQEVMNSVNAQGMLDGTAGVVNTLFIAEAWANFGLWGVVFSVIWVGFIIQLLYSLFIYSNKNPIIVGLYAYLCYKIPVTGGFNDFFYHPTLFLSIVIIFIVVFFAKRVAKN